MSWDLWSEAELLFSFQHSTDLSCQQPEIRAGQLMALCPFLNCFFQFKGGNNELVDLKQGAKLGASC